MNNTDIKVTVVIPVYNAEDYLGPAMDSIITQTLTDIEIICVDDGSTDASLDIIREYQNNDSRIRIVTETNAGPAIARNNGIRRARGKYIAFLDADDFYEPSLLEELYNEAERDELDVVITNYDVFNTHKATFERVIPEKHENIYQPNRVTSKSEYPDYIFTSTNGAAWNKLFRTEFVKEKELVFLTDVRMYEDVYFTVTALSLAERVGKVHKTLLHHRIHSEQSRAKHFRRYYSQVPLIYAEIKKFLMKTGMYSPLVASFLNLTAERCYKIFNLLGSDAKEDFWNMLHDEFSEFLGWHGHTVADFEEAEVFDFVANVELYDYKQYKKRLARRKKQSNERLHRKIKKAKQKRRLRTVIASIFGKNK